MKDIPAKTLSVLADLVRARGLDEAAVFGGLPFPLPAPHAPAAPAAWIDWDDFCDVLERLEQAAGGPEAMARLGEEIAETAVFRPYTRALRLIFGPRTLYRIMERWLAPTFLPLLDDDFRDLGAGRVEVTLTVPQGRRNPHALWRLIAGNLRAYPRLLGLPDAYVDMDVRGRSAVFLIVLPPAGSVIARARRAWSVLRAPQREVEDTYQATFEQLVGDQQELTRLLREASEARGAAEQAARLKAAFLSTMSHEVRTPMNGVIGMAELLLDTSLDPEQQACAETIRDSARALMEMLNGVLDLSKLEAGRVELEPAPFEVRELVESVVGLLRRAAHERRNELRVEVAPEVPRRVVADAGRLRQVLLNLVDNAVRFTEGGQITVRVTAQRSAPREGVALRFEVEDTGVGIALEARTHLFRPFVQLNPGDGRRGGTGLGLSICKHLVELMGGTIGVESEPGAGSSFHFLLRATLAPEPPAPAPAQDRARAAAPAGEPVSGGPPASRRVLVVDDHAVNRRLMIVLVQRLGYTADAVDGGEAAVDAVDSGRYDAVLMDCSMPDVDGFAATARIRSREAQRGGARIPIVAVTASVQEDAREECIAAGMDDYLSKPVDRGRLAEVLERTLGAARDVSRL